MPSGSNINDGTYQEFFDMVLIRFPSAYDHYYLLDVIRKVAKMYHDEGRACHFVLDLIQLRLPNLFLGEDFHVWHFYLFQLCYMHWQVEIVYGSHIHTLAYIALCIYALFSSFISLYRASEHLAYIQP